MLVAVDDKTREEKGFVFVLERRGKEKRRKKKKRFLGLRVRLGKKF